MRKVCKNLNKRQLIKLKKRRKEENKRIFHQGHSAAAPDQGDA